MKKLTFLLTLLLSVVTTQAADALKDYPSAPAKIERQHPYLFTDAEGFKQLAQTTDKQAVEMRIIVLKMADDMMEREVLRVPERGSDLGFMRNVEGRLITLSFAYNLTGNKAYLESTRRQIKELLGLQNWGTYHFLDIGECALGMAIAYDWLYPVLTAQERTAIEKSLVEKALAQSFLVRDEPNSWLKGNFNWNQVCHCGVAVSALAIYNEYPVMAREAIERAAQFVPYAAKTYEPDGATPEGPSYWEYGTTFQVILMDAMKSVLGHCYGLDKYAGFMKTADFRLWLNSNAGGEYGYSDYHGGRVYHAERPNEPVMMWFAREQHRSDFLQSELEKMRHNASKTRDLSRLSAFDLIWYKPLADKAAEKAPALDYYFAHGEMPIAFMRTDKKHGDAYVGFKGGTANNSHGHMDAGSFIYESKGERWATDLGTESYDKMRQAKLDLWNYSQNSSRWTTFRTSSEAHNLLRIDNEPVLSAGIVDDATFIGNEKYAQATLELTPLYNQNKVKKAERTMMLDLKGNLTLTDRLEVKQHVTITSQWMTDAVVSVKDQNVILEKHGKKITISAPDADAIEVDDVSSIPGIQNSANPDCKRIRFIKTLSGGTGSLVLTVKN